MNVVLFLTDQERAIQHFPPNWLRQNLPGMRRLRQHGVSFERAFTNACMCSPARSTLMSGYFPAQHGVKYTLEEDMPFPEYPHQVELPRPPEMANLATVMRAAGYNVVYKGKWHCSKPARKRKRAALRPRALRLHALEPAGRRRQPERPRGRRRLHRQRRPLHRIDRLTGGGRRGRDAVPQLGGGQTAALLPGDLAGQPARRPLLPEQDLRRSRLRRLLAAGRHRRAGDQRRRPLDQALGPGTVPARSSTSPASRRPKRKSAPT